jgi:hypothetical protein
MKYITTSWPSKEKRSSRTSPYWKHQNDLKVEAGTFFYKDRIVIPEDLRKWCLDLLHDGHLGISRCMSRAKETIWWPGITRQIEDTVNSCEICIKHRQPVTEPMLSSEIPTRPWQVIGADLAEHENEKYLVIQDYYSKYPEIRKLKKTTSNDIIEVFKEIFARHRIPEVVRSDNGRQFDCLQFREFAKMYSFKWTSSSPQYPQSNGQAESAVKLLKKILKKNDDLYLALLSYRNTSLSCGASPAQLLFGRALRDRLPISSNKLLPQPLDHNEIRKKMTEEKEAQKRNYDNRHRGRENIDNMKREGTVQGKTNEPRSFQVETEQGVVRRNRKHLQLLPPTPSTTQPVETNNEATQELGRGKRNKKKRLV